MNKGYLDPAFYQPVFLKLLFLSIADKFNCVPSSSDISLNHTVKYLALSQRGFTRKRVIFTYKNKIKRKVTLRKRSK